MLTGPPGAGKSTAARALASGFEPSALVAGDDFFGFIDRGFISPWLPEADAQNTVVTAAAAAAAGRFAAAFMVVYDGVVGPWFLRTFAAATGLVRLHYAVLLPPMELCVQRVRTRAGHGFTDLAAARHMYLQLAQARIDPRHLIVDPPTPADAVAALVRDRITDGSLLHSIDQS